jgi:endonuclease/exonuclease/phosphatase (EEP) superfamily protein YafD
LFSYFRLQYTAALLLGMVALGVLRRAKWMLVPLPFLVANLVLVLPYVLGGPEVEASSRGPEVRLVLANVNAGNKNHDALKSFLREADADVILLEEITPAWAEALADLDARYPHSVQVPQMGGFGIGLWSRLPLRSSDVMTFALESVTSIVVTVDVEGKMLRLVGTHPLPPRNASNTALRDQQLERAAAVAVEGGPYSVLLGDFNVTPWGSVFRRIGKESGLRDSGLGMGIPWTWPDGFWPLALPLDRCLVSEGVEVVDRRIGPDIGSDHYPLVVDLRLTE